MKAVEGRQPCILGLALENLAGKQAQLSEPRTLQEPFPLLLASKINQSSVLEALVLVGRSMKLNQASYKRL